jgi:hypothetical protein
MDSDAKEVVLSAGLKLRIEFQNLVGIHFLIRSVGGIVEIILAPILAQKV